MRSPGELYDELSVTNIKLWFTQEKVFEAERTKSALAPEFVARLVNLNAKRTDLINQINAREGLPPIVKITE